MHAVRSLVRRRAGVGIAQRYFASRAAVSHYKAAVQQLKHAIDSPACANTIFETSKWPGGESSKISDLVKSELASGESTLTVPGDGDGKEILVRAPVDFSNSGENVPALKMNLPTVQSVEKLLQKRAEQKEFLLPVQLQESVKKFFDAFLSKRSEHAAMLSVWGPKTIRDSMGEVGLRNIF